MHCMSSVTKLQVARFYTGPSYIEIPPYTPSWNKTKPAQYADKAYEICIKVSMETFVD